MISEGRIKLRLPAHLQRALICLARDRQTTVEEVVRQILVSGVARASEIAPRRCTGHEDGRACKLAVGHPGACRGYYAGDPRDGR